MSRFVLIVLLIISVRTFSKDISYDHKKIRKFLVKNELSALTPINTPESVKAHYKLQGCFFKTKKTDDTEYFVYIGRVNTCRAGGCSDPNSPTPINPAKLANTEYFDYLILYNSKGVIEKVKIYRYQATHGYEITAKGWLKQFKGVNGKKALEVGTDVDAISGATISVYAITFDILKKTELLNSFLVKNQI